MNCSRKTDTRDGKHYNESDNLLSYLLRDPLRNHVSVWISEIQGIISLFLERSGCEIGEHVYVARTQFIGVTGPGEI